MKEGWIYKTFRDYLDKVGVYMVVVVNWFLRIKKKKGKERTDTKVIRVQGLLGWEYLKRAKSDPIFHLLI